VTVQVVHCDTLCLSLCVQSVVHVSTGYSQVDKTDIDEVIYDSPLSPSDLISMTK